MARNVTQQIEKTSVRNHADWKIPIQMLHIVIRKTFLKWQNYSNGKQDSGCQGSDMGGGMEESECGCKGAAEVMQTFVAWLLSMSACWCEVQDGTSGRSGWKAHEDVSLIFHICIWIYDYLKMKSLIKNESLNIISKMEENENFWVTPGMARKTGHWGGDSRQRTPGHLWILQRVLCPRTKGH